MAAIKGWARLKVCDAIREGSPFVVYQDDAQLITVHNRPSSSSKVKISEFKIGNMYLIRARSGFQTTYGRVTAAIPSTQRYLVQHFTLDDEELNFPFPIYRGLAVFFWIESDQFIRLVPIIHACGVKRCSIVELDNGQSSISHDHSDMETFFGFPSSWDI